MKNQSSGPIPFAAPPSGGRDCPLWVVLGNTGQLLLATGGTAKVIDSLWLSHLRGPGLPRAVSCLVCGLRSVVLWSVACGLSLWALVSISTSPVSHTGGTTVQLPASITLPIPADINSCAGGEHLARHTAPRAPRGHSQLLYLSSSRCIITPPSAHLLSPLPPLL